MNETSPVPVRATLVHQTGRRARIRLEDELSQEALSDLANRLAAISGLDRVLIRPHTGSVIFESHVPIGQILDSQTIAEILDISEALSPPPVGQLFQFGMIRLNESVKSRTEGSLDLRTAIAVLLVFAAIVQLSRGKVVGPSATLLMSALSLLDLPKK